MSGWSAAARWRRATAAAAPLLGAAGGSDIVVNLLPLTPATRGLLDARFFAALPRGASLVNLARGAHVVDADLLAALDSGHLRHAVLDVFHTEPLPADHPFWRHPRVTVLPHAAAQTDPRSAAAVVGGQPAALRATAGRSRTWSTARGLLSALEAAGVQACSASRRRRSRGRPRAQPAPAAASAPGAAGVPGLVRPVGVLQALDHAVAHAGGVAPVAASWRRPAAAARVRTAAPWRPRRAPRAAPSAAACRRPSRPCTRFSARMSSASVQCTSTGGLAFGLQAVEHAQRARHLAGQHRLAELEDVVARHVQHRRLDLLEAQLARRVQQRQLLHLLVRGQQVAFDAVGKEGQRALAGLAVLHALALARQALRDPGRQRLALHRLDAHRHAGARRAR